MEKRKLFLPKNIYQPIGMKPPRFAYLVKKGVIRPDVQESLGQGAANVFSPKEALRAGLFYWFEKAGFTEDVSIQLADEFFKVTEDIYDDAILKYYPLEFMFEELSINTTDSFWMIKGGKVFITFLEDISLKYNKIMEATGMGYKTDSAMEAYRAIHRREGGWLQLQPIPGVHIPVHETWFESHTQMGSISFFNLTLIVQEVANKLRISWEDIQPYLQYSDDKDGGQ